MTNVPASAVTNGVYTTGSYADPSWIASLAGNKISGNISGNAASITGSIAESQVTNLTTDLSNKAASGANSDITSLAGLTTPLFVGQGGTGQSTLTANKVMVGNGTSEVLTPTNLHWDNANSRLGIGTSAPQAKLEVAGDLIRTVSRAHGYNQVDGSGSGAIATRALTFTKKQNDTLIRVTYTDSRSCYGQAAWCAWEVRFNGGSCGSPGPLNYPINVYNASGAPITNNRDETVIGNCAGLSAGTYTIQVYVNTILPGAPGTITTGANAGYWALEAEEVR